MCDICSNKNCNCGTQYTSGVKYDGEKIACNPGGELGFTINPCENINSIFRKILDQICNNGSSIFTDFTITGDGTEATPYGVNYVVNKILYVDIENGNDSTAQKNQPLKAYQNPQTAINAAEAGDTIVVISGDYSGQWNLKHLVNIHFLMGVNLTNSSSFGRILVFDSSANPYSANITGYANIVYNGTRQAVRFNGIDLNVNFECLNVISSRDTISWVPRSPNARLTIKIFNDGGQDESLSFYSPGLFIRPAGSTQTHETTWTISWGGKITAGFLIAFSSNHTVNVVTRGEFYAVENAGTLASVSVFGSKLEHYGNVYSLKPYSDPYALNGITGLVAQTQGEIAVHGNIYSLEQPCFRPVFAAGKTTIYNSKIHGESVIPIFNKPTANGLSNTYFYNCKITDGVGNTDPAVIKMEDDITSGGDVNHLHFYSCEVRKEPTFAGTGGVIYKNQPDTGSKMFMYNSTIMCGANQDITETDIPANGNFYFDSCRSNKGLGTDTFNVGGTLIENDTYLV